MSTGRHWGSRPTRKALSAFGALLLAGTALSSPLQAQEASSAATKQPTDVGNVDATGSAASGGGETALGVTRTEVGGGLMVDEDVPKAKSSVTKDFIQKQAPAADVFQVLKLVPGANAAAADAYGFNPGIISVRGLDATQMGFNFEGMPLSDMANWSVYPGEWIDTENMDVVTLNQGSADLASPQINATGGVVDLYLHDPAKTPGGLVDFSYGSNNAIREFARLETGQIDDTGLRGFVSFSHFTADHFRGPGEDQKDHVDMAVVKDFDDGSRSKLALTYSEIVRDTYKNPTLAQWQAGGLNGAATNYDQNYTKGDTSYYKLLSNPWRNLLISAPTDVKLNTALSLKVTPYFYYGYGLSGSATTLNESSVGFGDTVNKVDLNGNGTTTDTSVMVYNPIFEENIRTGGVGKLSYNYDNHTLVAGYWFQYSDDKLYRPYSTVNSNGTPSDPKGVSDYIRLPNGQIVMGWNQDTIDYVNAVFAGDTISFMDDRLSVDLGVKQVYVSRFAFNGVPSTSYETKADRNATLPTAAARFSIDDQNQIFGTLATSFRTMPAGSLYPRYSASTGAVTTAANPNQPNETSFMQEIGYRFHAKLLSLSVSGFNYDFRNRQISSTVCDPGCLSEPINGGSQNAKGVDFEAGLRPYHNIRPYVSGEYLNTTIESNIPVSGVYLPTKGKDAVRSPRWQAGVGLDYDDGDYFGNLGLKHVASQYATFMNDQSIPAYTTVDATIGFRLPDFSYAKKPEIRLNILNLFDRHYLSGVASPTTNALTTNGVAGSAPTYYVANGLTALVTITSAF